MRMLALPSVPAALGVPSKYTRAVLLSKKALVSEAVASLVVRLFQVVPLSKLYQAVPKVVLWSGETKATPTSLPSTSKPV